MNDRNSRLVYSTDSSIPRKNKSVSDDQVLTHDDALGGLLRAIQDMELDDNALGELTNEVSALRQKLPAEILGGEDRYDPGDPDQLKDTLEDIKELLVNRLLSTEQRS